MQKIHRRSGGDKEAKIGFSQITDNQFSGASRPSLILNPFCENAQTERLNADHGLLA